MPEQTEIIKELEVVAKTIRRLIVKMIFEAKSGHPGGSLSATDLVTALYFSVLKHDPKNPKWLERDRFHLSKGHACPVLYAALALRGYFPEEQLMTLRKLGSVLQGHPDSRTPGIEVASGSLGQGLSVALGMSLATRLDNQDSYVYCLMGDGEVQEGNIWEAAMAAAHFKCGNLIGILDYNGFQIDGCTKEIMNLEPIADKWRAFGWRTIEIDGHNMSEILRAYAEAKMVKTGPVIIIAHTVKGKGVSFMENVVDFHGKAPTKEELTIALKELE